MLFISSVYHVLMYYIMVVLRFMEIWHKAFVLGKKKENFHIKSSYQKQQLLILILWLTVLVV